MDMPQPLASAGVMRAVIWLLPYCEHFEACADDRDHIQERFAAYHQRRVMTQRAGLLFSAPRHYAVVADSQAIQIRGPYGYKAWTMHSDIVVTPASNGSRLVIKTRLHRRVALMLFEALVVVGIFAVIAGFPLASLIPLFAAPFFYAAAVIATKIEAAEIAQLVRRIAHGEDLETLSSLPELD